MSNNTLTPLAGVLLLLLSVNGPSLAQTSTPPATPLESLRRDAEACMLRATRYFTDEVATHGGYVYFYEPDLSRRWGEGEATSDQIWVQPPGTPSVGLAFIAAYDATESDLYRDAIAQVARALTFGQLESGGWTNCIDFAPNGAKVARYRKGSKNNNSKRLRNHSSLDDGQTQTAIRFLVEADRVFQFAEKDVHDAADFALDAMLRAQYPCGAFPQVWTGPVASGSASHTPGSAAPGATHVTLPASLPEYDWRSEGRIKEYWNLYTLNDDVAPHVADTLLAADRVYSNTKYSTPRYSQSLLRLGEFLLVAQLPEPQPAWAQQYNFAMHPAWARAFEPPAIAGHESQQIITLLMQLYELTGDAKFLEPIPRALAYLQRSRLPNGQLSRYYELDSNRPLYMERRGGQYTLTYQDTKLPEHYGWKIDSNLDDLQQQYENLLAKAPTENPQGLPESMVDSVKQVIASLSPEGQWISTATGERLVGQNKFPAGKRFISSEVFCQNIELLAAFITACDANH